MKDNWKDRYEEAGYLYGKGPNDFFAQFIDTIPARKLLLPFAGEGRNAVYAAQYGWGVDAFDLDEEKIAHAQQLADEKVVSLNYQKADLYSFQGDEDDYDLIALIRVQLDQQEREKFHRHLLRFLKKGGRLIMEAYAKEQPETNHALAYTENMLYSKEDLRHDFPDLRIDMLHEKIIKNDRAETSETIKVLHMVAVKE